MKKYISQILIIMFFICSIGITWWGTSVNSYRPDEIEEKFYEFEKFAISDSTLRAYDAFLINGDTLYQEAVQNPQMFGDSYIGRVNVKQPRLQSIGIKDFTKWLKEN